MTVLQPYHRRYLTTLPHKTEYLVAISTAAMQRWYPLFLLLRESDFTPYEVGALIRLREEYEGRVGRRG
jgi:hypothetical protein